MYTHASSTLLKAESSALALPQLTTFLTAALDMPPVKAKKQAVIPPNVNYYLLRCACVFLLWGVANSWVRSVPPCWFCAHLDVHA